mmetsp:Transcript_48385/g.92569  ORF Transcript_48385/g.92569 Transcript_48385/m.92569 type:complete len:99 (+) Transcript_48385:73-369(+)
MSLNSVEPLAQVSIVLLGLVPVSVIRGKLLRKRVAGIAHKLRNGEMTQEQAIDVIALYTDSFVHIDGAAFKIFSLLLPTFPCHYTGAFVLVRSRCERS